MTEAKLTLGSDDVNPSEDQIFGEYHGLLSSMVSQVYRYYWEHLRSRAHPGYTGCKNVSLVPDR